MGCDVSVSHFLCTLSFPILLHRADLRSIDEVTSFDGTLVSFSDIAIPACHKNRLSSYLVWVGVKFSNAKEEELLINDASQIGSKKFDFSIE